MYVVAIIVVYLLIRITGLTLLPVFCDEGIYIHWAQIISRNFSDKAFIPLTDGKTPLFMWLVVPFLTIFSDPLIAGRFVSILSGLSTLSVAYLLTATFFTKRITYIALIFFTTTPLIVFFDRMALADSLLGSLSLWSLYLSLLVATKPNWKNIFLLGLILGTGIWVKTPGIFSFLTLPIALLAYDYSLFQIKDFFQKIFTLLLSAAIGLGLYNILRVSHHFQNLSERNEDYHFPISRIFSTPFDPLSGHVISLTDWLPKFFTWPILLLILASIPLIIYKRNRIALIIFLWGLLPLVPLVLLLKVFTVRYILFGMYPFLILASWALVTIFDKTRIRKNNLYLSIILFIILIPSLVFDYFLTTDPTKAPLPQSERKTYLEEWTAGYGLKEIADYLIEESKKQNILVVTDGFFGTLPDGLQIYLQDNKNISIWYLSAVLVPDIYESSGIPKFFVVHNNHAIDHPNLELVHSYPRAVKFNGEVESVLLYRTKEK